MIELIEPATSILDPTLIVLKEPDKWRDQLGIKDFLGATPFVASINDGESSKHHSTARINIIPASVLTASTLRVMAPVSYCQLSHILQLFISELISLSSCSSPSSFPVMYK